MSRPPPLTGTAAAGPCGFAASPSSWLPASRPGVLPAPAGQPSPTPPALPPVRRLQPPVTPPPYRPRPPETPGPGALGGTGSRLLPPAAAGGAQRGVLPCPPHSHPIPASATRGHLSHPASGNSFQTARSDRGRRDGLRDRFGRRLRSPPHCPPLTCTTVPALGGGLSAGRG